MEYTHFPYSSYNQNPGRGREDKQKSLKGGGKAERRGNLGSQERHGAEFPEFSFASYMPDMEPKKPAPWKHQYERGWGTPGKACSWPKDQDQEMGG